MTTILFRKFVSCLFFTEQNQPHCVNEKQTKKYFQSFCHFQIMVYPKIEHYNIISGLVRECITQNQITKFPCKMRNKKNILPPSPLTSFSPSSRPCTYLFKLFLFEAKWNKQVPGQALRVNTISRFWISRKKTKKFFSLLYAFIRT